MEMTIILWETSSSIGADIDEYAQEVGMSLNSLLFYLKESTRFSSSLGGKTAWDLKGNKEWSRYQKVSSQEQDPPDWLWWNWQKNSTKLTQLSIELIKIVEETEPYQITDLLSPQANMVLFV